MTVGCDIHPYVEVKRNGKWVRADVKVPNDRDYWAFAKLANVRNGMGFAGSDTGDPVEPISEPRGLPSDTSIQDTDDAIEYGKPGYTWLGDHSHSWVTLDELLSVDYTKLVTHRGFVKKDEAKRYRDHGWKPREWCSGVWGPSAEEYEKLEWQEPLRDAASLLPQIIASICHLGEPQNVRLVFGFDS